MASTEDPGRSLDGLPEMLTVCEAAAVLRIGRTLAYQLASRYLAGEDGGIPVVRLGGCLRVPLSALTELVRHGRLASPPALDASVAAALDALLDQPSARFSSTPPESRRPRRAEPGITQLSLLDGP
jgi:hypothetical protein